MASQSKYLTTLLKLLPVGVVGTSLVLGAAYPSAAALASNPKQRAEPRQVAERLAAVRDAVSEVIGHDATTGPPHTLAWGNWGYGWGHYKPWNNWHNWRNWGNWFRNW